MMYAEVAKVQIGYFTIDGLHSEDGQFYVAVPQICDLFSILSHNASRDLKAMLGKDIPILKLKTKLHSNPVNCLPLSEFERLLLELTIRGNAFAQQMLRDLVGLSLHQVFCDTFGVHFEKEERQTWQSQRNAHYRGYHPLLTKWLKQDANGDSNKVNWAFEINRFKKSALLPLISVDLYDREQLMYMNMAEELYCRLRERGFTHIEAIGEEGSLAHPIQK